MAQPESPEGDFLATRGAWVDLARRLVAPAVAHQSEAGSELVLPGQTSWHGERADGLESFARVFLLDALAGCQEPHVAASTQRLIDGITVGVGPSEARWIRAAENHHALVEATSLCLGLWVGDHRLWNALDAAVQDLVCEWLVECAHLYLLPRNNWIFFAFTISRFLDSIDRPHERRALIEAHLFTRLEELYRGDGWYSDDGDSTFDYYNSFAFHFYPGVIAHLGGDSDLRDLSAERLSAFLPNLVSLIGPDGGPIYFGRSMTYRCAVVSPLSVASLLGIASPAPAEARAISARTIGYFEHVGGIVGGDPLAPGWGDRDTDLVQSYSGPGAAYWANQVFSNLLLPADHAYWSRHEAIVPRSRQAIRLRTPNLLVSLAEGDTVLRLSNHGSYDTNAIDIQNRADDPYYGRLSYSSAALPLVTAESADNTFTVLSRGRRYRRGRIVGRGGGDDWAASEGWLRELETAEELSRPAQLCTISTGSWDIHFIALPPLAGMLGATVVASGWAVVEQPNDPIDTRVAGVSISILAGGLFTELHGMLGFASAHLLRGTRPRGPWAMGELSGRKLGGVFATATLLHNSDHRSNPTPPSISPLGSRAWIVRSAGQHDHIIRLARGGFSVACDGTATDSATVQHGDSDADTEQSGTDQ